MTTPVTNNVGTSNSGSFPPASSAPSAAPSASALAALTTVTTTATRSQPVTGEIPATCKLGWLYKGRVSDIKLEDEDPVRKAKLTLYEKKAQELWTKARDRVLNDPDLQPDQKPAHSLMIDFGKLEIAFIDARGDRHSLCKDKHREDPEIKALFEELRAAGKELWQSLYQDSFENEVVGFASGEKPFQVVTPKWQKLQTRSVNNYLPVEESTFKQSSRKYLSERIVGKKEKSHFEHLVDFIGDDKKEKAEDGIRKVTAYYDAFKEGIERRKREILQTPISDDLNERAVITNKLGSLAALEARLNEVDLDVLFGAAAIASANEGKAPSEIAKDISDWMKHFFQIKLRPGVVDRSFKEAAFDFITFNNEKMKNTYIGLRAYTNSYAENAGDCILATQSELINQVNSSEREMVAPTIERFLINAVFRPDVDPEQVIKGLGIGFDEEIEKELVSIMKDPNLCSGSASLQASGAASSDTSLVGRVKSAASSISRGIGGIAETSLSLWPAVTAFTSLSSL